MKKGANAFIIMFFVMVALGLLLVFNGNFSLDSNTPETSQSTTTVKNEPVVGNDKDAHGCIGSAGYTWCESSQKCLRVWEEKCEQDVINEEVSESTPAETDNTAGKTEKNEAPANGTNIEQITYWKQFYNKEHGYSLEFPENCTLEPLGAECKALPPEERTLECLCFLNGEDPNRVTFQTYTGEHPNLTLATLEINHFETAIYNPPADTELVAWVQENFAFDNVPEEPNFKIGNTPAIKIYSEGGPGVYATENYLFINAGKLFNITLIDVANLENAKLYDYMVNSLQI
jgi:hypothetical protein